jgi:hypothetical protein
MARDAVSARAVGIAGGNKAVLRALILWAKKDSRLAAFACQAGK